MTHAAAVELLRTLAARSVRRCLSRCGRDARFFTTRLTENAIPGTPAYDQLMNQLGHAGMNSTQRYTLGRIDQSTGSHAIDTDILYLTGVLFLVMIVFVFFAKLVKGATATGGH